MNAILERRMPMVIAALMAIPSLLTTGAAAPTTAVRLGRSPLEFHLLPGTRSSPPSLGILFPGDGTEPVLFTLQAVGQQSGTLADPVVGVQVTIPWSVSGHKALRRATPVHPIAPVWTVGNIGLY